jgi:hypothetical protein
VGVGLMPNIYENARAVVIDQLKPIAQGGKGQVVTLSFVIPGAYDDDTQAVGDDTTVTQECSGVEKSIKAERVDGTSIQRGDSEFVLSPVTTAGVDLNLPSSLPAQAILTFSDGRKPSVVFIDAKKPSGLLISATLQLRG